MAGSKDQERVHPKTGRGSNATPTTPGKTAEAVRTPPPQTGASQPFDSEAPTILHEEAGYDAATLIELSYPSEAPTVLETPARAASRPVSKVPASNWSSAFLLPTGSILANRYEILQMLGEGGMGAVYKARDNELDRVIALKVIRPELASNPEILQRFKQELVLARQVTDRNIIRIFDLGEADGIRFITMEYVEGTSLYQVLQEQGQLPVKDAAEIIEQVLTGLKAAHREGVIHRDLKPGNIMRDPNQRYQTAQEFIDDLHKWEGAGVAASLHFPPVHTWGRDIPWHWIGGIGAILVLAVATFFLRGRVFNSNSAGRLEKPPSGSTPVSVLVADFQNNTSDTIFDGTLEPMLNVALEGASFIDAFNRGAARQFAEKLQNPTSKLDKQTARLVAVDQGISAIVTGSLDRRGNGYELSAKAIDAVTGKVLATDHIMADNKDQLLLDVPKLAAPIRQALGDNTPESVQLAASQGTFKVSNLEAVHQYSIGMEQQAAGKMEEGLQSFSNAVQLDPNFARAYAAMAAVAGNLGQTQNAEKYAKLAMEHVDRMTERERYFVRGMYYMNATNWQKCVKEYSDFVKQYPADQFGENNLAICYARLHNMPKAMEEGKKALQLAPKDAAAGLNFALYSCYATAFESCAQEASKVFELNPNYEEAFLALAYAQAGENQLPQARDTYQKLEKVSTWVASLAAVGMANLALYDGRFREAVQILEKGAAVDLTAKKPDAAADKFAMISYA